MSGHFVHSKNDKTYKMSFEKGETILYFQTRILFVSFIATVIISIFVIPILKKLKVGQIERDDGPHSHYKKQGTPTMGGIIIALRNNYRNNWRVCLLQDKRTRNSKKHFTIIINNNRIWNNWIY